jgi:hypothetical protein
MRAALLPKRGVKVGSHLLYYLNIQLDKTKSSKNIRVYRTLMKKMVLICIDTRYSGTAYSLTLLN